MISSKNLIILRNIQEEFADSKIGDIMLISIIRTVIIYAFVILAIRLMGKRQISDLQPSELVVTLMVSEIATLPLEKTSQPLTSGLVPVLILISCEILVSVFMMKNSKFRNLVCGSPVTVIEDGKILQKEMKRLRMTTEDLCVQLRQQNVFSLDDVQYCIVETNGKISVLEKPDKRTVTLEDMNIKGNDNKIETVVINDGELLAHSLQLCGSNKKKVYTILKKEKESIENIFIMTLDGNGKYKIITKEKS